MHMCNIFTTDFFRAIANNFVQARRFGDGNGGGVLHIAGCSQRPAASERVAETRRE